MKDREAVEASPELRQQIYERDNRRCRYCGGIWRLMLHHVEHRSQGGKGTKANLILLCERCHILAHEKHPALTKFLAYWQDRQLEKKDS